MWRNSPSPLLKQWKMAQPLWKTRQSLLKKLKRELSCGLETQLLDICPKELKLGSGRDLCTFMFIAALFTVAKWQGQPECSLTDDWLKNMWSIHIMEYHLALEKISSVLCDSKDEPGRHSAQ